MCTLGAISGSYLFKTRDLWTESGQREEIVFSRGRYHYVGVRGYASPLEWGLNSGVNEKGLAVAITFVDSVPLAEALAYKTPRGVLVEELLRTCADLTSALRVTTDFLIKPLVGGTIVVVSPEGGFVVEQIHPRFAVEFITEQVTVRTNHFLNLRLNVTPLGDQNSSVSRYNRMKSLLGDGSGTELQNIQAALADHQSPYPVCSHSGELRTVSGAIYDLRMATLYHAAGSPCNTEWLKYQAGSP